MSRPPTAEELAAIAAAYVRLQAPSEPPAPPSRWRLAARALDVEESPVRRRAAPPTP